MGSFEEAASVFGDPLSNTYSDSSSFGHRAKIHYYWNVRAGKMLVVAHTDDGEEVRIISAREMTAGERKAYEED